MERNTGHRFHATRSQVDRWKTQNHKCQDRDCGHVLPDSAKAGKVEYNQRSTTRRRTTGGNKSEESRNGDKKQVMRREITRRSVYKDAQYKGTKSVDGTKLK